MFCVYRYTNNITGTSYIGKTKDLSTRKCKHRSANGDCPAFHSAIRKYGYNSFKFEILLKDLSDSEACHHEKQLIEQHDTYHNGYNCTIGGEGIIGRCGSQIYNSTPEDTIKKILLDTCSNKEAVEKYNVSYHVVFDARAGKTWKHMERNTHQKYDSDGIKLNSRKVEEIRKTTLSNSDCAVKYNVTPTTIRLIRSGKRWGDNKHRINIHYNGGKIHEPLAIQVLNDPCSNKDAAEKYGVSRASISNIRTGKSFVHLKREDCPKYRLSKRKRN